jgi:hypothetical protein
MPRRALEIADIFRGHEAELLIAKSARSSAGEGLSCQCRSGLVVITSLCQVC